MKITKIEEQKKRKGRVNIYVDDLFAFGISEKLLVDHNLYKDKELNESEIKGLQESESVSRCLDKAYYFLSFRPRSEKEMKDKLLEKFEPETVELAIDKLKKYNYINDGDFARMWIASRGEGRSAKALSFELARKGIDRVIIEEATSAIDKESELESALQLVAAKSKYHGLEKKDAYQKIGGFLSRRGYGYDIIKRVIDRIYEN